MKSKRYLTLLAGIALTAAACGGGAASLSASTTDADSEATAASDEVDAPVDSDTTVDSDTAVDSDEDESTDPAAPLFSPTESTDPLDLSGGATSSDEGVEIVTGDPREGLNENVAQATSPWPTDWTRRTIDPGGFLLGIQMVDPRDRIPPIDRPQFESITAADWLDEREPGALVQFNDEVRFYPLSLLTRHEVVNDRFGDIPVVVTFCPLCNTAITFDARVDGEALRFGVSGLLRNSDLVMWDSGTTTLWQQITGEAVVGQLAGTQLELIPTSIVSYGDALENFPDALSLARETGFSIQYGTNSYNEYSSSVSPFLFDGEPDDRFPALSRVVGVNLDEDKAYPFSLISEKLAVNDEVSGIPIAVLWGSDTADALDSRVIADSQAIGTGIAFDRRVGDQTLTFASIGDSQFTDAETGSTWTLLGKAVDGPLEGEQLETVQHRNEFWFAWAAFFPDAPVYETS